MLTAAFLALDRALAASDIFFLVTSDTTRRVACGTCFTEVDFFRELDLAVEGPFFADNVFFVVEDLLPVEIPDSRVLLSDSNSKRESRIPVKRSISLLNSITAPRMLILPPLSKPNTYLSRCLPGKIGSL